MKKMKMVMAMTMTVLACTLSSCGQKEDSGNARMDTEGSAKEIYEENPQTVSDEAEADTYEGQRDDYEENPQTASNEAEADTHEGQHDNYDAEAGLEYLTGDYDYLSDYGNGKLTIEKNSYGYDISDYESESSYRFLADSSNIETIEDNRIYMKYPEQVSSDGMDVFGYYILEYGADGISVYYGKTSFEDVDFLYHATKKTEATADELLDLFINGQLNAVDSADLTSTFNITDLNRDSEEWDSFSVGEKVDLDNDGENELVISGPYGGIYLDARNNKVYEFAAAEGTALTLSYTIYNGAVWIMYSNSSSAGFRFYHMEKFEGADNLVAEINFGEELADPDNAEAGMKYTLNEAEISYDEYTELCSKIFAAQVDTGF